MQLWPDSASQQHEVDRDRLCLVCGMRLKEEISTGDRRSHHTEEVMFMEHAIRTAASVGNVT